MKGDGVVVFDYDARTARWAEAARVQAVALARDPEVRSRNLRHGDTWFVGVDVLPNDAAGAVDGIALEGPWAGLVPDLPQHAAQVSIVYPGYPVRDPDQSEANHRYRIDRMAAHVDGLLPIGPDRRRFPREFHAYILGLPLNDVPAAPTVVWKGSHKIMQSVMQAVIGAADPAMTDVTDAYHTARKQVFETCEPEPIQTRPGQAFLLHRFALHGTAPWTGPETDGRMIAFFRPEYSDPQDWLHAP